MRYPISGSGTNTVFVVSLRPLFSDARTLTASAVVGSDAADPNLANNTAVDTIKVRFKPFRH